MRPNHGFLDQVESRHTLIQKKETRQTERGRVQEAAAVQEVQVELATTRERERERERERTVLSG